MKISYLRSWLPVIMVVCVVLGCTGFGPAVLPETALASPGKTVIEGGDLMGSPYPLTLPEVQNPEVLEGLNDAQRKMLEANGFVVVPEREQQIYTIYTRASRDGWPAFVTTDAVLHTFHILYDYALRQAEYEFFVAALGSLTQAMQEASLKQMQSASGEVKTAARDNVAFFAVAQRLLKPEATVPSEIQGDVKAELDLIMAHRDIATSPLSGNKEDYSQYVPRGHYTRNETFGRYFRAMMWLGRVPFLLRPGNTPDAIAQGQQQTRRAILIVNALQNTRIGNEPAAAVWERIYEPTAFFVGRTDDLDMFDYAPIMKQVYGEKPNLSDLQDVGRIDRFIKVALALPSPRIVSAPVTDLQEASVVTKGFRFMGQRFVFDSYIFQQLVYDKVKGYRGKGQPFTLAISDAGPIRGFPRGLDVATVFGSQRAAEIIRSEGDADYEGYDRQLTKLQKEVQGLTGDQWTENLYWSWLNTLRPLLEVKGKGYPAFMQKLAWVDKDLHSFLGSWAELRHDTVLYAKQSMTIKTTSAAPPAAKHPQGYVEPEPEVFARVSTLTQQMLGGLQTYAVLGAETKDKLEQMGSLLEALKSISERELKGEALSQQDYDLIEGIGSQLSRLTTFSAATNQEVSSETDKRMAIVADVHTDANTRQVLEEGVGDAFRIFVVVPDGGASKATVGGVFSYYEFKQPMSDRLTDEAWQAMQTWPLRPAWTASFIAE